MPFEFRKPEVKRKKGTIGYNIAKYRCQLDLSPQELAEKCNISRAHISNIEIGRFGKPSLDLLLKICNALGCTLSELLEGVIEV